MIRNDSGYTIVEAILAIIVLGIVAASIHTLFVGVQRIQRQAAYLDTATRAAQHEIESLRNNNYNSLTPGEDIDFSGDLPDSLPEPRRGIAEVSEPEPGLRRVDVSVTYGFGGEERSVELSSLIGIIGISQ